MVFGERHLRHVLLSYMDYYNTVRTHLSLAKDAPCTRPIERFGDIVAHPSLMGSTIATHESSFQKRQGADRDTYRPGGRMKTRTFLALADASQAPPPG